MTCIAYRAGMLAGDSAWADSGTIITRQSKLVRMPSGALYGASGDDDDRELVEFLATAKGAADLPSREWLVDLKADILALVILPNGSVWLIDANRGDKSSGAMPVIGQPYIAIGSGRDLALGAMAAGAGAAEAVRVACRFDTHCREPVHILER